jgi:hypothetical protein
VGRRRDQKRRRRKREGRLGVQAQSRQRPSPKSELSSSGRKEAMIVAQMIRDATADAEMRTFDRTKAS